MSRSERWLFAGCATSFNEATFSHQSHTNNKLYIKFKILPDKIGYEALLTDFNGHLWRETLIGRDLQYRLQSEASGLEIETPDLLNLLSQMCQNFIESSCEISSDLKNLILKTSVKIGFIKLKWTFKAESCGGYDEMIKCDFLLPFFAYLRDDKVVRERIEADELDKFYETVIPNLKTAVVQKRIEIDSQETTLNEIANSNDAHDNLTVTSPVNLSPNTLEPPVDSEELKRKALEEQLQAAKKKKKKLI